MRYYEASSMIASSPEAVWAVLTDVTAWPSWDSGIDRVDGQIPPGEEITIRSQAAPGRVRLVWRPMPDLGPSFGRFAQGFKRRAETGR